MEVHFLGRGLRLGQEEGALSDLLAEFLRSANLGSLLANLVSES